MGYTLEVTQFPTCTYKVSTMPQKNFPAPPRATLNLWGSLPSPVKREPVPVLPVVPVVQKVSTAMNSIKVRATASIRQVAPGPPPAIRTASSPAAPVILQAPPKPSEFPALMSTPPLRRAVTGQALPAIRMSASPPAAPVTLQAPQSLRSFRL